MTKEDVERLTIKSLMNVGPDRKINGQYIYRTLLRDGFPSERSEMDGFYSSRSEDVYIQTFYINSIPEGERIEFDL